MSTKESCQIKYTQLVLSNLSWHSFPLYLRIYLAIAGACLSSVAASAEGLRKIK